MTRLVGTEKPDLGDWTLEATDRLEKVLGPVIKSAAAEALHYAMENKETCIMFPAEWAGSENGDGCGNPAPDDPLTIYLRVALTCATEPATYAFNLREALQDTMEECAENGEFKEGLVRIRDALRLFSDEIDKAVRAAPAP